MVDGNQTVKMTLPKEKLQDILMGNIKLGDYKKEERADRKVISNSGLEKMISNSGATVKSVDSETKELKDSVRKEKGELTQEEYSRLSIGEKEQYRKEFPKQGMQFWENERKKIQGMFASK